MVLIRVIRLTTALCFYLFLFITNISHHRGSIWHQWQLEHHGHCGFFCTVTRLGKKKTLPAKETGGFTDMAVACRKACWSVGASVSAGGTRGTGLAMERFKLSSNHVCDFSAGLFSWGWCSGVDDVQRLLQCLGRSPRDLLELILLVLLTRAEGPPSLSAITCRSRAAARMSELILLSSMFALVTLHTSHS